MIGCQKTPRLSAVDETTKEKVNASEVDSGDVTTRLRLLVFTFSFF